MYFSVLLVMALCSLNTFRAQISVPGKYRNLIGAPLQKGAAALIVPKEYTMPPQDNLQLNEQAEADEAIINAKTSRKVVSSNGTEEFIYTDKPPKAAPYQFGKAIDLVIDMKAEGAGEWTVNKEMKTKTWRFKVSSKDAYSISIYFSEFNLASSTELYIIGQEDTLGAFTSKNNKKEGGFGIAPVSGEFLILEYIEPIESQKEHSSIVVSHIVHGFRPNPFSMKTADAAGNCNFNVACPEGSGKTNAINSVALLINGKGESFCTGAMINNVNQNGRQLFLTAEHCIGSSDVKNFMVGFHYQYKYCSSLLESRPQIKTVHGMKLLDKSDVSDYALMEVLEEIPDDWDVFMAGWDATASASKTGSFYAIHHPRGDTKKVSLHTGQLDIVRLSDINNGINFWRVSKWEKGVTEPGSSGSPLFDSNGAIIGHLLGGESKCSNQNAPDYYGALSRDWVLPTKPIIKHLDPKGSNKLQLSGAPLKQLREQSNVNDKPLQQLQPVDLVSNSGIITVTKTVTKSKTETITLGTETERITQTITSRLTITVPKIESTYNHHC